MTAVRTSTWGSPVGSSTVEPANSTGGAPGRPAASGCPGVSSVSRMAPGVSIGRRARAVRRLRPHLPPLPLLGRLPRLDRGQLPLLQPAVGASRPPPARRPCAPSAPPLAPRPRRRARRRSPSRRAAPAREVREVDGGERGRRRAGCGGARPAGRGGARGSRTRSARRRRRRPGRSSAAAPPAPVRAEGDALAGVRGVDAPGGTPAAADERPGPRLRGSPSAALRRPPPSFPSRGTNRVPGGEAAAADRQLVQGHPEAQPRRRAGRPRGGSRRGRRAAPGSRPGRRRRAARQRGRRRSRRVGDLARRAPGRRGRDPGFEVVGQGQGPGGDVVELGADVALQARALALQELLAHPRRPVEEGLGEVPERLAGVDHVGAGREAPLLGRLVRTGGRRAPQARLGAPRRPTRMPWTPSSSARAPASGRVRRPEVGRAAARGGVGAGGGEGGEQVVRGSRRRCGRWRARS